MPRQANGNYLPPANTAAITATTISSTAYNTLETDIGTELTNSLDRFGRSSMQAALPMGGNKITGMADPTASTDAATKSYVDASTAAFFSTGDVKFTLKAAPDSGWLMFADQTIGNISSGATYANVQALALYTLIWNNVSNAYAPVVGGRGASASADWAAQKPMQLLYVLGRALAVAGTGSGYTAKSLGQTLGVETVSLSTPNLPAYTPTGSVATTTTVTLALSQYSTSGGVLAQPGNSTTNINAAGITANSTSTFTGTAQGGTSAPFSVMNPTVYLNVMVKL